MLLQEPAPSPYDLQFRILGYDVRIAWTFWLMAAVFGYGFADVVDQIFLNSDGGSPGVIVLLLIWAICVLISITIHELGHAIAFSWTGIHSMIVLYHFGGLAIPLASRRPGISALRLSSLQNLVIAAAGPFAQLCLAALVIAAVRIAGYQVIYIPAMLTVIPGLTGGEPIRDVFAFTFVNGVVWPSIAWAILNLIPVWPLDGGRIAREIISVSGGTTRHSLALSLAVGCLVVLWSFNQGQPYLGFLFISLAIGNWQELQSMGSWQRF